MEGANAYLRPIETSSEYMQLPWREQMPTYALLNFPRPHGLEKEITRNYQGTLEKSLTPADNA